MEIFFLKKDIFKLNKVLKEKSNKIHNLKNESFQQLQQYNEQIKLLEKQIESLIAIKLISAYSPEYIEKQCKNFKVDELKEKINIQQMIYQKLNQNNLNAKQSLKEIRQKVDQISQQNQKLENSNTKKQKQIEKCKRQEKELKQKIKKVLKELQVDISQENYNGNIDKLINNITRNELEQTKKKYDEEKKKLQAELVDMENSLEFHQHQIKESQKKQNKYQTYQHKVNSPSQLIKNILVQNQKGSNKKQNQVQNLFKKALKNNKNNQSQAEVYIKKLRCVQKSDVQQIFNKLKYKLLTQRISLQQIHNYFQNKLKQSKGQIFISLMQVQNILQQKPFELCENDANLLARFCTEENSLDYVDYDEQVKTSIDIFRSIFNNMMGDYYLCTQEEIEEVWQTVKQILAQKKNNIIESFTRLMKIRGDYASQEQICYNFLSNDIFLEQKQNMILFIKLFEHSQDLDKLPYTYMLQ